MSISILLFIAAIWKMLIPLEFWHFVLAPALIRIDIHSLGSSLSMLNIKGVFPSFPSNSGYIMLAFIL